MFVTCKKEQNLENIWLSNSKEKMKKAIESFWSSLHHGLIMKRY